MGALIALRSRRSILLVALLLFFIVAVSLPQLISWQRINEQQAMSLSHLRRVSLALQLYSQDYDDRLMPLEKQLPDGRWITWPHLLGGYGVEPEILENPANPTDSAPHPLKDPLHSFPIETSYSLNRRFYGVFGSGPFLLDNLEMPEQTALLVEAGPMWASTGRERNDSATPHSFARLEYGDTTDRVGLLTPYPSSHANRIALAAADGHAVVVRVAHYHLKDGPHDPLYGRIGGDIYNWNGGHPNGRTDRPPRE